MRINNKLLLLAVFFFILSVLTWFLIPSPFVWLAPLKFTLMALSLIAVSILLFIVYGYPFLKSKTEDQDLDVLFKQDVKTIEQMFKVVFKKLKQGRGHKVHSVYELPWYILLGTENGAKSSLLEQNDFESILEHHEDSNKTNQYIRFWGNEDAVVIEVGHRLFNGDGIDSALWRILAKQLLKYRPRQAVNGIVTVTACDTFLPCDKNEVQKMSTNFQEAIRTLGEYVGLSIPVYTLFTKADTIADFVNFFNKSTGCDVDSPFGVTFPVSDDRRLDADNLAHSNLELLKNLSQQQFQLLRDTHKKSTSSVLALPYQLGAFFERASELLTNIGRENRVRESVWLRGFYMLTTGQKGGSYDLLTQIVAEKSSFNATALQVNPNGRQSLFSNRIFSHVILPEAKIVGVNKKYHFIYMISRILFTIVLVWSLSLFGLQMKENWEQDERFRSNALYQLGLYSQDIERLRDKKMGVAGLVDLVPVLNELREVNLESEKPLQWYETFGLEREETTVAINQVYQQQLQIFLLPEIAELLTTELNTYVHLDNHSKIFELLGYYHMLFNPHLLDQYDMSNYIVDTLNEKLSLSSVSAHNLNLLMEDLFKSDYAEFLPVNDKLTAIATQKLEGLSPERLIYERLKATPKYRKRVDIRLQLGSKFNSLFQFKPNFLGYLVPELYTRQVHSQLDLSVKSTLLKEKLTEYKSIQGDMSGTSISELTDLSQKIQRLYYSDYVYQWKELLNNIEVKDYAGTTELSHALKLVREPATSPLIELLAAVVEHTTLAVEANVNSADMEIASAIGVDQVNQVVTRANELGADRLLRLQPAYAVNEAFSDYANFLAATDTSPAPVADLVIALDNLNTFIDLALTSSNPSEALFVYAKEHASGSQDAMIELNRLASSSPGKVSSWITEFNQQMWKSVIHGGVDHLNQQWKVRIHSFYRQAIEGRFPFAADGRGEVAIKDFSNLFKPQGQLEQFISDELQPFVYWNNGELKLRNIGGETLPLRSASLSKIQHAKEIKELFYGERGEELALKLRLKAISMSTASTLFNIHENERLFSYSHGPRLWQDIAWPPTREDGFITVNFYKGSNRISNKSYTGQWGLFRFIFDGQSTLTGDNGVYRLEYKLDDENVIIEYTLKYSVSDLKEEAFTSFYLPETLAW